MKTEDSERTAGTSRWSSIERWAIERVDRDAGMTRIECVPMRSEYVGSFTDVLLDTGVGAGMDLLSYWDLEHARIRPMPIGEVAAELGLRDHERDTLSENMVFWVVRSAAREPRHVIHATRAARETAKELYSQVTRREER